MTKEHTPKKVGRTGKSDITAFQRQLEELTAALQRERADATNIRRRHDEQVTSLKQVVKASILRDLLPVVDNFERALKHVPAIRHPEPEHKRSPGLDSGSVSRPHSGQQRQGLQDDLSKYEDFVKGIRSIVQQFEKTLADLGVERIKTIGEPFDPRYHEAVSMEEGDGTQEIVSEELQAGYKVGDNVIRHAMVRVKLT